MAINLRWFKFLEGWIAMAENPTAVIDGENVSSPEAFVFSLSRFVVCCIAAILVPVVGRMMLLVRL
jgi:hypothetical protein